MRKHSEGRKALGGPAGGARLAAVAAVLGLALAVLPAPGQEMPSPALDYRGLPSERMAVALSAVGTTLSVLSVFTAGELGYFTLVPLFAGPSLGAMYGGLWGRALIFTALRFAGSMMLLHAAFDDDENGGRYVYAWIGGMALTAVIEMATVGKTVRRRNERLARRRLAADLAPFVLPRGVGVQVRLSF